MQCANIWLIYSEIFDQPLNYFKKSEENICSSSTDYHL